MGKLTLRLIKYFIGMIVLVIIFCFLSSSIFLSYFYVNMQYSELKTASDKIYEALKSGTQYSDIISEYQVSSAILVKDGEITTLSASKMGMMSVIKNTGIEALKEKGKYKNQMNQEFLYYKNSTNLGDIIILQNNKFSAEYMRSTYIILSVIFLVALIISIPLVSMIGKRITRPIIKLQKASLDITQGNFDIDVDVDTKDEIQELSNSLKIMADSIEKKNVMQRDFIANVSHDFKTPLSVIRNYSEAIYDDILEEEHRKKYLKDIIKEVDRLNLLVIDILQLSKLQGGTDILKKENFNLNEFLLDFQNSFRIQLENKNLILKINLLNKDADIFADSNYLYRVIYNFIDNAIKFSNDGGVIELSAIDEEQGIRVSVKDNGEGIDEKYADGIWERYYKSRKSGGMGLGLAICSEILKLHNFEYGVISEKGKHTEFYFIIPFKNNR
ncbi:sensor histidine kinase [Clostridium paridis]|uniref:histidine kinase n=1 Tax=Clostridium paridis TaxID=2803863 RepID=A0A937FGY4_9CLOT|nr:HAMP domain-containing sensor histidine kinase [Clostridium paridis]MBL4931762.1 HAMP domain-containing histidine kinase [Clostridium paridis]